MHDGIRMEVLYGYKYGYSMFTYKEQRRRSNWSSIILSNDMPNVILLNISTPAQISRLRHQES